MKKLLFILSVFLLGFATYEPETTGKRETTTLKSIMFPERVTAFAPVQTVHNSTGSGTSLNVTISSTTEDNLVVVSIACVSSQTVTSVTDDQSNTYTVSSAKFLDGAVDLNVYQAYALQTTGGVTTITVNVSGAVAIYAVADEYSGNATSSVFDATGDGSGNGTSTSVTLTPSASGKLIVATLCAYLPAASSWVAGSGYTLYGEQLAGATWPILRSQYKLSGTTSETAPATYTAAFGLEDWAEIAQSYNPSAVTATPTPVLSAVGNEPSFFDFTPKNKKPK